MNYKSRVGFLGMIPKGFGLMIPEVEDIFNVRDFRNVFASKFDNSLFRFQSSPLSFSVNFTTKLRKPNKLALLLLSSFGIRLGARPLKSQFSAVSSVLPNQK